AVNAALIVDVVVLAVSGIMMSKGLFPALPSGSMSLAREAHMLASYWGFVLMSFHVGLYWHVARALVLGSAPRRARAWPHVVAACLMIWGGQAFVRRRIGRYMSMLEQFVFFDFEEPLWRFALDYVAVMILFACLGRYTMMLLRRTRT
ncbi:MAG: DUF4405 domain-containing protein, partial [Synergistaceae bacterium]|nr:DUF4405 domain-containing protein [Synergistaceae bacterium]